MVQSESSAARRFRGFARPRPLLPGGAAAARAFAQVPPFAKGMLLKLAAKSSVSWVAVESMREMERRKGASLLSRFFPAASA